MPAPVSMMMGSRVPTRYVLVPGPVIIPGLSPSTRPTRSLGVAVVGKFGSIQLMVCLRSRDAEIAALDVLVRFETGRRALVDDLALAHHVYAVRDRERQVIVLLDEEDREAAPLEPLDDPPDLSHHDRGQSLGGLVEQQQAAIGQERAA